MGELYFLCTSVDQGTEAFHSELGNMDTEGWPSARLARLPKVDETVAIGEAQFRFLWGQSVCTLRSLYHFSHVV